VILIGAFAQNPPWLARLLFKDVLESIGPTF
jgi:hypothetical protein